MIRNRRATYFIITILVIILGILSRKINAIPLFLGDVLYAMMTYFGCRMLFTNNSNRVKVFLPLLLCYLIEWQQCYNAPWIISIRHTTLGHYVLGQGFLWSDLLCYTVGVAAAFCIDAFLLNISNLKSEI
jgi:hypothetical protein